MTELRVGVARLVTTMLTTTRRTEVNENIRMQTRRQLHPRTIRRLRFEHLESRLLLAQATLGEHRFREDDFALSGTYNYYMLIPNTYDDRMNNADYSSSAARVTWTSPDQGTGFFEGTADGDGSSRGYYSGRWWACASYTLEEQGRFDFDIKASQSLLHITNSVATSTGYSYFKNTSPNQHSACNRPAEAPARFFSGIFDGIFDPANHTVAVDYEQDSPHTTVTAPAAPINWTGQAATDFALNLLPYQRDITLPQGWSAVEQTSPSPPPDMIDVAQGGLKFTVDVNGMPAKTSNVLDPVAVVRLFWATSNTDTSGTEIPITSPNAPVGVYWNSSQLEVTIEQFPERPTDAAYVRVLIQPEDGITDADLSNNSRYLQIVDFQALDSAGAPITEDQFIDGQSGNVLHADDASDPNVRVFGYDPQSKLGVDVQIIDDQGGYVYDPRQVASIQALAQGETVSDEIYFWAINHQMVVDAARHEITISGVNDSPVAVDDSGTTTRYEPLVLTPASLLANDFDIDHGDEIALRAVSDTSLRGAAVGVLLDGTQQIREIVYDPRTSEQLMQLAAGQQIVDEFTYEIVDQHAAVATGRVQITVTGLDITIDQVPSQLVVVGQPLDPITLVLTDADGDASDLLVMAAASSSDLVAADALEVGGTGETRTLTISPTPGVTGRTWITVTASDALGRSATMDFPLIVGVDGDRDLDGVPDLEEDAAPNGGDMNGDGIPDSWQPHVASLRGYGGQAYINVSVLPRHFLAQVTSAESPLPSGPAANAQFPMGLVHYEVVLEAPGAGSEITFRTNLATPVVNRYFQHQDAGGSSEDWQFLMHDTRDGARVHADRIVLTCRDGGRADQDGSENGVIIGHAALASVDHPWQNLRPEDVDNDGIVSPLDVLILINVLNSVGAHELGDRPTEGRVLPVFLDPSGNNSIEPRDVLQIINYLNAAMPGGEGEPWAGIEIGTPVPAADGLWRSEPLHQGQFSAPRSRAVDRWASQLSRPSDSGWSDRLFGQHEEAPFQFDELLDELFDVLGAAAIDLVPTGGNGLPTLTGSR
jgi:VCBS repeat-containing protein